MKTLYTFRFMFFTLVSTVTFLSYAQIPVADFTWSFPQYSYKAQFQDLSSNLPTSWLWSFGDGSGSAAKNPLHTYAHSGVYTVCLTASNGFGTSAQVCKNVTITTSNGLSELWKIKGVTYLDANNNCLFDLNEPTIENAAINLWSGQELIGKSISYSFGEYGFSIDTLGTYTLSFETANSNLEIGCPVNNLDTAIVASLDSVSDNHNFALRCKPGFDLAALGIEGRFRPGDTRKVDISAGDFTNFLGAHCATGISGIVTVTISGPVRYISPAPDALSPNNVNGNTIEWSVANFGTANFFSDFNILVQTDTTAQLGAPVCFTVSVTPTVGDNNQLNNILTQCFTIINSYDPNDKAAYPAGNIDTAQKELTYTIRFQNTGTAEAIHIHVDDTLDTDLDASTFQLLAYSHQPLVQLKENAVRFNFPNINLPDSNTNEPLSHGYVQYKVKLKANRPIGTAIHNTAFIYFDFNAPVVTNTTVNTIAINTDIPATATATANFLLFPNPASTSITVNIPEELLGSTLSVNDITGREMMAAVLSMVNSQWSMVNLSNGIYFLTIRKETAVFSKKLVVQG